MKNQPEFQLQTIPIKPISVNEVWQGKRFKTDSYRKFERDVLLLLPKIDIPIGRFEIHLMFGLSSLNADFDNPIKPFIDVLQKKYGFNDRMIYKATIEKIDVKKCQEFISFRFNQAKEIIDNYLK